MTILAEWGLVFDELAPISINKAYTNGPYGRRILTTEGRAFKAALVSAIARQLPLDWGHCVDAYYNTPGRITLDVGLFLPDLRTKSWRPGAISKKTKNRISPYKKIDGTNFVKLIQDAVVTATGIDDCGHLQCTVTMEEGAPGFVSLHFKMVPYGQ